MNQLEAMARGLLAIEKIYEHTDWTGWPVLASDACFDCMRAGAAIFHGRPRAEVAPLHCPSMRQLMADLAAAQEIAREVLR